MSDEVKEQTSGSNESSIDVLSNEPEVFIYKEKINNKIVDQKILVRRLSIRSIEKAISPILKVIQLIDGNGGVNVAALGLVNEKEITAFRDVISTCCNKSSDELADLPPSIFMKLLIKWLEVNKTEIVEFAKSFLEISPVLQSYRTELERLADLVVKKSETKI